MFEYFPGNYVWNLALNIAISSGAQIGELDQACRPAFAASQSGDDSATRVLIDALVKVADRVSSMAEVDAMRGRLLSAGAKFRRAAVYYATAERMHAPRAADREALYKKMLATFDKFVAHSGEPVERVDIPYQGRRLAALLVKARSAGEPAPAWSISMDSTRSRRSCISTEWPKRSAGEASRHSLSISPVWARPCASTALRSSRVPSCLRPHVSITWRSGPRLIVRGSE